MPLSEPTQASTKTCVSMLLPARKPISAASMALAAIPNQREYPGDLLPILTAGFFQGVDTDSQTLGDLSPNSMFIGFTVR